MFFELFIEISTAIFIIIMFAWFVHDKYVQRKHQLLINYPIIGRMRYFLEAIREPFRQYFANEDFYESRDKINWVYNASRDMPNYISFSPGQPQPLPKFLIKHSNQVLNDSEVSDDFSITIGEKRKYPFVTKSIIYRSAMSDGSISPEGTRAFVIGATNGNFPINTGEGGLTSNFFVTHANHGGDEYMENIPISGVNRTIYMLLVMFFNRAVALKVLRALLLTKETYDTYVIDFNSLIFFRPNWQLPFKLFPKEIPEDMPDIIYQMSSGFYGCRNKDGNFDEDRYKKVMSFCRATEIKIAQGAKQTGGKLIAEKVTPAIAYYRGLEPYKNIFSPNRFPFANTTKELLDFVGRLQKLSNKPVGFKIVISGRNNIEEIAQEIKNRKQNKMEGIPDYITVDGGDGGSATAPLELMDRIGLGIKDALFVVNSVLEEYGVRDEVKLFASGKILTPDDAVIALSLGADMVGVARGFMMSAGCIRARECSGAGGRHCPVGLATQDAKKRSAYLVMKQSLHIESYHNNLIKGIKTVLAVMGKKSHKELNKNDLQFVDKNGFVYTDVNRYLRKRLDA
ncbi:FMN-binding glutamate synthase family protein [Sulfurospirillum arcachonense]|uniref:FMN-binding glutamate synthase family protein n=1 Tax=Sulfurospirillum arcachonense TaxID=57666 RepID=UPI0004B84ED3|nr:FMN-binding glutamate synthase family protein [Sulfurospirillum arcachonense]